MYRTSGAWQFGHGSAIDAQVNSGLSGSFDWSCGSLDWKFMVDIVTASRSLSVSMIFISLVQLTVDIRRLTLVQ